MTTSAVTSATSTVDPDSPAAGIPDMPDAAPRWTTALVERLPQPWDDTRYELIEGELYVSTQPSLGHQSVCAQVTGALVAWDGQARVGQTFVAPGVIFAVDEAVAPDVVWVRLDRLAHLAWQDGKLHAAPDLMVEVISPGRGNERRDRVRKLDLYSRRGVPEYWLIDWRLRLVHVYRLERSQLHLAATLRDSDVLESPLLPGFSCPVARLFAGLP
jgi:Uma2 family endonuclease